MTVKELLEEGHEPTCFERAPDLGGVFRFDEDEGVVWESCRLTSSGLLTAFSDFPVSPERAEHMTVGEYVDYLRSYCEAFGVDSRIRYGTRVEAVTRDTEGWRVRTAGPEGERNEDVYDAVAVCSGLHQHPHRPRFAGQETFPGPILHGAEYRRPAQVAGKRVLIVGAGESGADVVAEVAEHAAETVLSLRRGVGVLPRKLLGKPNDYRTCRISNSSAHWVFETRNPSDDGKRRVYFIAFLPLVVLDKVVQTAAALIDELRLFADTRVARRTRRLTKKLLRESGGTLQEQFGTKSDDFVRAIAAGRCRQEGPIARFDGGQVRFEDGGEFEPDLVILCTGFDVEVPFLDGALARAPRFLYTFAPSIGSSLAFIGFLRPAFGAIPPLAELQARWLAGVLGGETELPPEAEMEAAIDRLARFRRHYFRAVRERLDYLVDYTSLSDELAAMVGCKPSREALESESRCFRRRFLMSPFVAAQYRLVGPHAKPQLARQVITSLPLGYPRHELATFYMRWTLSRVLHRVLGPRYAPKLALD